MLSIHLIRSFSRIHDSVSLSVTCILTCAIEMEMCRPVDVPLIFFANFTIGPKALTRCKLSSWYTLCVFNALSAWCSCISSKVKLTAKSKTIEVHSSTPNTSFYFTTDFLVVPRETERSFPIGLTHISVVPDIFIVLSVICLFTF